MIKGYKYYNNKAKEEFAKSLILLGNEIYKKIILFFVYLILLTFVNIKAKVQFQFMQIDFIFMTITLFVIIILAESLRIKGFKILNEL